MEINNKTLRRIFAIIGFAVLLVWIIFLPAQALAVASRLVAILSPLLIGGVIAFIVSVPMRAIESRLFKTKKSPRLQTLRRTVSLILALLFCFAVLAFVCVAVIPELVQTVYLVAKTVPEYFGGLAGTVVAWANKTFEETPELLAQINAIQFDWGGIAEKAWNVLQNGARDVLGSTINFAGALFGGVANVFIGLIFAVYLLFAKETLAKQCKILLYAWLSKPRAARVVEIAQMSHRAFANFITGQCVEACILGLMFALAMWIFRFPHVMLISVLIGFLALIPIFGAYIGCAVGAFLVLVQSPIQAVWFVVMFLIIQQVEGNLIYPKVVGKSVGLPALWVLVACTVGGAAFGLVGMLVMIPICSVLYAVLGENAYKRLKARKINPDKL